MREQPAPRCDVAGDRCSGVRTHADGANEAFGDCVRPRRPHQCPYDVDVDGGEDGVEAGGELAVAVADEEPEASVGVVEVDEQVASLLGEPRSGGVSRDAQDVHPTAGVFDDEERVEPVQSDCVEVNKSHARIAWACPRRNCAQVGPARRGAGSMPAALRIFQTVEAPI